MNTIFKIFFVVFGLGFAIFYKSYKDNVALVPAPELDSNFYWGPGDKSLYKEDVSIKSKKISYDVTVRNHNLIILKQKNL